MGKLVAYISVGIIFGVLVYLYQALPDARGVLVFATIFGVALARR